MGVRSPTCVVDAQARFRGMASQQADGAIIRLYELADLTDLG